MTEISEKKSYLAEGPVALIVGCGDMGMGCARALGRRHPLLVADVDHARLEESIAALRHEGYTVEGQICDITDRAQVDGLAKALPAGLGVKVLAHVAAIGNTGATWRKVMEVDLIAVQLIADAIGPRMERGGVAIFISSTGAQQCPRDERLDALLDDPLRPDLLDRIQELAGREPNFLEAYFMAKRGMNRLSERLAIRWGAREVRSLSVSPGLIDSTMGRTSGKTVVIQNGTNGGRLGTRSEMARETIPLGRQGTVPEVIAAVDFLASDAASFINGIDVAVDGGGGAFARAVRPQSRSIAEEQLAPPPLGEA